MASFKAPVPVQAKLHARLEQVFKTVLDEGYVQNNVDPTRLNKLRISSFPFCPRRWFFALPSSTARTRRDPTMTLFFTSIGTTVHTVMQTAIESLDEEFKALKCWIVRDWKCRNPECGCVHVYVPRPSVCKNCGESNLEGIEHTVVHGNHIVGHIDETLAFLMDKLQVQITCDYKTTSGLKIDKGELPLSDNVAQIEAYAAIKKSQGHPVIGWCLIYICRDNPSNRKLVLHLFEDGEVEAILKKLSKYEIRYVKAQQARKALDAEAASKLSPLCSNDCFDKDCNFVGVCEGGQEAVFKKCNEVVVTLQRRKEKARGKKI